MKKLFLTLLLVAVIFLSGYGLAINKNTQNKSTESPVDKVSPENNTVPNQKKLDLSNQGLTKVSQDVFKMTVLEELDVSGNKLTGALPAEIRQLKNLRILDASNNQMTGVPAEIGQLQNLQTLDLSNNQLTGLPYELGNLKNLKTLNLSGNNYSIQDLEIIRKGLPADVNIVTEQ